MAHALLSVGTCQNESEDECATACPGECAVTLSELQRSEGSGPAAERRLLLSAQVWEQDSHAALLSAIVSTLHTGPGILNEFQLGPLDDESVVGADMSATGALHDRTRQLILFVGHNPCHVHVHRSMPCSCT